MQIKLHMLAAFDRSWPPQRLQTYQTPVLFSSFHSFLYIIALNLALSNSILIRGDKCVVPTILLSLQTTIS